MTQLSSVEDEAGVDIKLIGDSLGMVMQGHETTLPVTIDDMVYHTACVARGNKYGLVLADMNFRSHLVNEDEAVANAVKLMQAGAHMVKFRRRCRGLSFGSPLNGHGHSRLRTRRIYASVCECYRRLLC